MFVRNKSVPTPGPNYRERCIEHSSTEPKDQMVKWLLYFVSWPHQTGCRTFGGRVIKKLCFLSLRFFKNGNLPLWAIARAPQRLGYDSKNIALTLPAVSRDSKKSDGSAVSPRVCLEPASPVKVLVICFHDGKPPVSLRNERHLYRHH